MAGKAKRNLHCRGHSPEPRYQFSTVDNIGQHARLRHTEQIVVNSESLTDLTESLNVAATAESGIEEPQMCAKVIKDLIFESGEQDLAEAKILDFGAGRGQLGQILAAEGYTELYAQEGSDYKK